MRISSTLLFASSFLILATLFLGTAAAQDFLFDGENPVSKTVSLASHHAEATETLAYRCSNPWGADLYVVKDRVQGVSYSVTVLQGVLSGDVRVSWNNQLPSTYSGVAIYIHSGGWFSQDSSNAGVTGACGKSMGRPSGGASDYRVVVDFGGVDVTVRSSTSQSYTLTVSANIGSTFEIGLTNVGASTTAGFGVSGSVTMASTYEVEWVGKYKRFQQAYSTTLTPQLNPLRFE